MEQPEYEWMYHHEDSHWWFVSRRRLAQTMLAKWVALNQKVLMLDVGCGTGGNLAFLSPQARAVGIDLNALALNLAQQRQLPGLTQGSGLTLPYSDDTFTLVTAFDVFYHRWIVDDTKAIKECVRVLKPGGWLLLTDSALPGLASKHDETYYTRQRYVLGDMQEKLIEAGLQPLMGSYTNTLLLPAITFVRWVSRWLPSMSRVDEKPMPQWLNQMLINLQRLEAIWLQRGGTFPLGSSIISVSQKPLQSKAVTKNEPS